jgi:hypothetical protein
MMPTHPLPPRELRWQDYQHDNLMYLLRKLNLEGNPSLATLPVSATPPETAADILRNPPSFLSV